MLFETFVVNNYFFNNRDIGTNFYTSRLIKHDTYDFPPIKILDNFVHQNLHR